jgi:hypothetical protein
MDPVAAVVFVIGVIALAVVAMVHYHNSGGGAK